MTLAWLDEHYPGEFECVEDIRYPGEPKHRNFDRIQMVNRIMLGTFINITVDSGVLFMPAQMKSNFEIFAADPEYFKHVKDFAEMWHVYTKTTMP